MKLNDYEYIWIKCIKCKDRVKVAKNKGSYFSTFNNFLRDFLIDHSDCDSDSIVLEISDK